MTGQIDFYHLPKDIVFVVVKDFTDFYGNDFAASERLIFVEKHFLPYEGGHTLVFRERKMYLQETEQREIIENFSDYLALACND